VRRSPLARPLTALVAATLVTGALAGCSGFPFGGGCTSDIPAGDASSTIVATGDLGEEPSIEFPTPLIVNAPERSLLTAGEGAPIEEYSTVALQATIFDAASGAVIEATEYSGSATAALFIAGESLGTLGDALVCATVGSRVALVTPVEMLSDDFDSSTDLSGNAYIVVIDVMRSWLGKANGVNQLPLDGMPTVVTAVDGTPGVTVSTQLPPTTVRASTIKAGAGATVADDDTSILGIRGWSWSSAGSVTLSTAGDTWAAHRPVRSSEATLPDAVNEQLVGAKVGSQILIVLPNDDGSGDATIYVIDVLGIDDDQ
jgi:hypothetical protein